MVQDDLTMALSDLYTGGSLLLANKFFPNKDDALFVQDSLENIYNITDDLADELGSDNPLMVDLEAAKKALKGQDANTGTCFGVEAAVNTRAYQQSSWRVSCALARLHNS